MTSARSYASRLSKFGLIAGSRDLDYSCFGKLAGRSCSETAWVKRLVLVVQVQLWFPMARTELLTEQSKPKARHKADDERNHNDECWYCQRLPAPQPPWRG
jgi:hypothetical protein